MPSDEDCDCGGAGERALRKSHGAREADARIRAEQFAIDAGFGESSKGYRTAVGTVNAALIRDQLKPGGALSAHYNAGPRIRKYWGEKNVSF